MSRRDNIAKEQRKQAQQSKKLARKQKNREELERVIIACEGEVTEVTYFKDFFDELIQTHHIAKTSLVIAKHKHTNPTGVLKDLIKELECDSDFEHKWIVIDRDEEMVGGGGNTKEDFNSALAIAKSKKINVAYSNPSFEIWYLLHFEFRNTAIDRYEVVENLAKLIGYEKNQLGMFNMLKNSQMNAISNAKKLLSTYEFGGEGHVPSEDNPSTAVHRLIEVLNNLMHNLNGNHA